MASMPRALFNRPVSESIIAMQLQDGTGANHLRRIVAEAKAHKTWARKIYWWALSCWHLCICEAKRSTVIYLLQPPGHNNQHSSLHRLSRKRKWKTCYIEGEEIGLAPPHHHYRLVITNPSIYQHHASRPPMYSQIQICQSRPGHKLQPPVLGKFFKRHNEEKVWNNEDKKYKTRSAEPSEPCLLRSQPRHRSNPPSSLPVQWYRRSSCRWKLPVEDIEGWDALSFEGQRTKLACFWGRNRPDERPKDPRPRWTPAPVAMHQARNKDDFVLPVIADSESNTLSCPPCQSLTSLVNVPV